MSYSFLMFHGYKTDISSYPAISRSCDVFGKTSHNQRAPVRELVQHYGPPTLTHATTVLNPSTTCSIPGDLTSSQIFHQ